MRRGLILAALGIIVAGGGVYLATRGGNADTSIDAAVPGLETQTVSAGKIDVKIEPAKVDDSGATFAITLDTHSVELSVDLTLATLDVDGTAWAVAGWSGDEPGGHHREGELRFEPAGPATGTLTLTIPELPEPVEVTWNLDG